MIFRGSFSRTVRETVRSGIVTVRTMHITHLGRQNSTLCCFENFVLAPLPVMLWALLLYNYGHSPRTFASYGVSAGLRKLCCAAQKRGFACTADYFKSDKSLFSYRPYSASCLRRRKRAPHPPLTLRQDKPCPQAALPARPVWVQAFVQLPRPRQA